MTSFFIVFTGNPYTSEVLKPVEENQVYMGWTKYDNGAVTDRFKDLKVSSKSGNAIPIR